MEDVADADYAHAKRICKDFKRKFFGNNHDLYVQSDTFLLAEVLKSFRDMCLKIYKLDPGKCVSAAGLPLLLALKMTKIKLNFSLILICYLW